MPNTNAPYHHDEYGHVRVIEIDDETVVFESMTETVDGAGQIPTTWSEPIAQFNDQTDPVDRQVGASCETVTIQ